MHTIPNTITKICGLLLAVQLSIGVVGCRKEGFTRLMDVEMKYKVVPNAERIPLGDTVKLIAWLPYKQFDKATNSTVDIRDMEVQHWGAMGYKGLDTHFTAILGDINIGKFESFFEVRHPFGTFQNYPQNHIIGTMHQNDTAFYFELKLVARKPGVFMLWGGGGRGFMDNGRFRIDIAARIINPDYHQHLMQKYMSGLNPSSRDYFFETY